MGVDMKVGDEHSQGYTRDMLSLGEKFKFSRQAQFVGIAVGFIGLFMIPSGGVQGNYTPGNIINSFFVVLGILLIVGFSVRGQLLEEQISSLRANKVNELMRSYNMVQQGGTLHVEGLDEKTVLAFYAQLKDSHVPDSYDILNAISNDTGIVSVKKT